MDIGLLGQYIANGLMLGMMYALVAVGFTLFFGVLDVIKFSHGDVLMVGAFAGLATYLGLEAIGVHHAALQIVAGIVVAVVAMGVLGGLIAKFLVLPLKSAPALNTLLLTLMLGTVLREAVRLFYPDGSNPKPFPALLPATAYAFGNFTLRLDSLILFVAGLAVIAGLHLVINATKLGLAIRAVAQAEGVADALLDEWEISQQGLGERSELAAMGAGAKAWRCVGEMREIARTFRSAGLPGEFHDGAAEIYHRMAALRTADATLNEVLALLGDATDGANR